MHAAVNLLEAEAAPERGIIDCSMCNTYHSQ